MAGETTLVPKHAREEPLAVMPEMRTDFARFFNEAGWPPAHWPTFRFGNGAEAAWIPGIDIFERSNRLVTRIDLPT